jgi:F-type H+-transporting ATPase subunit b
MSFSEFLQLDYEAGPIHVVAWEVLYLLVLVLVVSFVLNRLLFRPVLAVLARRQAEVDGAVAAQDGLLARVDQLAREQAARLAAARREAVERVEAAKAAAEARRAADVARAREAADDSLALAETRVREAAETAERALRTDVAALAKLIAARVLGREVA